MNPVVDTIVMILFVMLLVYIFRGYHLSKMREREEKENRHNKQDESDNASN